MIKQLESTSVINQKMSLHRRQPQAKGLQMGPKNFFILLIFGAWPTKTEIEKESLIVYNTLREIKV